MIDASKIEAVSISCAADIRPAAESLQRIIAELCELRTAVCHNIASKQPMVDDTGLILAQEVFGWVAPHERWWQNSCLALRSPIPLACRYESEPFWCNTTGFYTRQNNPYLRAIDLANLRRDVGASAAIVVPIHLPFGQIAAAGFSRYDSENADLGNEYALFADELALYARVFVSGYVKATCSSYWLPRETRLSRHEVECLRWAAIGKTDEEISRIIGRSRSTVRFHVNSASAKLGAANR